MSVHSHTAAHHDAATPEFPRHVVTAVLVSHDGGVTFSPATTEPKMVRLYKSDNGREFQTLVENLFDEGYPNETSLVKVGDRVTLRVSGLDESAIETKVNFLSPEFRNNSQITVLRASVDNREMKLKPGQFAQVYLTHSSKEAIAVPVAIPPNQSFDPLKELVRIHVEAFLFPVPAMRCIASCVRTFAQRQEKSNQHDFVRRRR